MISLPAPLGALSDQLQTQLSGSVRFDEMSRWLYSTDASSYQVLPVGVVLPRTVDDICATVTIASRNDVSLVPRGGGTSLSGQTIGAGVVLDHSRYLNEILEINAEAGWVRVQSGVVLDRLNRVLAPTGWMVGPDPASSASATLGGMIGNNSTGSHSIKYGMVADFLREVEVVLSDGSVASFGPRTSEEVRYLAQQPTLEGQLYRDIPALLQEYAQDIATGYPKTWRNVAGYNLHRLLQLQSSGSSFNLAPLIAGSEGTLGVITSARLALVRRPKASYLVILHFDDLRAALESVPAILEAGPSAVELVDRYFNLLTRQSLEYGPRMTFIHGDPAAVLIVEFSGDEPAELEDKARKLEFMQRAAGHRGPIVHAATPAEVANVWFVRKASLGLLMSKRGDAKPLAFVDDATVPVDSLADYAIEVQEICAAQGTEAAFYAHASAGCLHINPLINLKTHEGLRQLREISQAVERAAIRYGGTTTGEHGEGFARSYFNEMLYGPRLHRAFCEIKGLFDPHNRLNPGKIVNGPEPWNPAILRFNPSYQTPYEPNVTFLDFSRDGGFGGLVEMCNGQGVCRKVDSGTMCPSYMATREEAHSTRGRANALRAAITGALGPQALQSDALHDVLDLCLECKACKRECPSLVDMAKLKYEYLAQRQAKTGVPLRSRLFGNIATVNRLGSLAPGLANWSFRNPLIRAGLDRVLGIDKRRTLPALAPVTFQSWFQKHARQQPPLERKAILWDDTFLSYNDIEIGKAAVRVLEACGYQVEILDNRKCCARPMISKGMLAQARSNAEHNVRLLLPYAEAGIPIVGIEPSCLASFRDEYPDLLRSDAARTVAANAFFIEEFLAILADEGRLQAALRPPQAPRQLFVHGHCQEKALIGMSALVNVLRLLPDTTVTEIDSGCCGMAGAFGYEKEHYEVSMAVGEDRLLPLVRSLPKDAIVVAPGTSCRHQISDGAGRRAWHPVEVIAGYVT